MGESKPRSSSRVSSDEHDRRKKGGGKSSSSNRHKSSSNRKHKSHSSSNSRSRHGSRRDEEDAKRKERDSSKSLRSSSDKSSNPASYSSRSEQRDKEDREAKRRARDSTRSSTSSYRSSTNSRGTIDDDEKEKERKFQEQNPFESERSSDSLDLLGNDDGDYVSVQDIDDQRSKLSSKSGVSKASKPGAVPKGGRPSANKGTIGSFSLEDKGGSMAPSREDSRQPESHEKLRNRHLSSGDSRLHHPPRNASSSSAAPPPAVHAMAVEEMEDERVARLEEQNLQLQREMEDFRRGTSAAATPVVHAEEAVVDPSKEEEESSNSKRTWMIIAFLVCLAVAIGGGVAAALLAGGGSDDGNTAVAPNDNSDSLFGPPSAEDCSAIFNGLEVFNQTNFFEENFEVRLDVSLSFDTNNLEDLEEPLEERLQQYLITALVGCESPQRRRLMGVDRRQSRRRLSGNHAIGNAIATVECDPEAACTTLDSDICYQCIMDLQLFLKASDVSDLESSIGSAVQQDLIQLLQLTSPFQEVNAVSVRQVVEPTPTMAPTLGPRSCTATIDYFKGPFRTGMMAEGTEYTIGCGGYPTTLFAIVEDKGNDCFKCLGMLAESDYGFKCPPGGTEGIEFQISGVASDVTTFLYGYVSTLSESILLSSCPEDTMKMVATSGSLPPSSAPGLEPTSPPGSCPLIEDYFDGPLITKAYEEGTDYTIGCGGYPTTLFAIVEDEDNDCVKCVGMLPESEYGFKCPEGEGGITFQISGMPPAVVFSYGYVSTLSESSLLSSCPDDTMRVVATSGSPPPTSAPVTKPTAPPSSAPVPVPTPPPSPAPVPAPTPPPVSCSLTDDYFDGPFLTETLAEGTDYTIGCGGYPTTLFAIVEDDNTCVKCVGMLTESDYGSKCPGGTGGVTFQLSGTSSVGATLYYGFVSESSESNLLPSCPGGNMIVVATADDVPRPDGNGGGGGGGPGGPNGGGGGGGPGGGGGGGGQPPQ